MHQFLSALAVNMLHVQNKHGGQKLNHVNKKIAKAHAKGLARKRERVKQKRGSVFIEDGFQLGNC